MNRRPLLQAWVNDVLLAASALFAGGALSVGCAEPDPGPSPADRGKELFLGQELSRSSLNQYSCSTCHDEEPSKVLRKPGAPMAGVTQRKSFWGGKQNDLLGAINDCRRYFMVENQPLLATEPRAEDLYAYLSSLEPGSAKAAPFSVVRDILPLERGDAARGEGLYAIACGYCHGSAHTGNGRLSDNTPILPEDTNAEHADLSPRLQRLVFIEKVRHGAFLGYGGDMPPLSLEVLSDAELADVLEYMQVVGE
jgi:thiosulfate dehydrogenase